MANLESFAIGLIDLVDSTGYYPEGGDMLGKEAKRRHNEISNNIFKKHDQNTEPPKGDGFLFWGKDPIQTCLASIDVIKRIKTEVISSLEDDRRFTMATKIVITKGLIEKKEDKKDFTHGIAAHKCQRIMDSAKQKHHTILIDSSVFDEIKNHLNGTDIIYSGPYDLEVDEFGKIQVYQIADKEMGLIVDPTRTKLKNQIKKEIKDKVKDELEDHFQNPGQKKRFIKTLVTSIVITAIITSSIFLVILNQDSSIMLQDEVDKTVHTMNVEVKNAALMIYEVSKNDIIRQPLLTTYAENFPIMITEKDYLENGIEKQRIEMIKTLVDGMDALYYLFVIPPDSWDKDLHCRLYVIYPVGALIPGENPGFLQQRDWCDNKDEFEMYLSSSYYSRGQKEIVTTMIIPIFDENKQEIGYLAGAINFDKILKETIEESKIPSVGFILVDHDNCIVASKYKIGTTIDEVVDIRKLHYFDSGNISISSSEASCQNGISTQLPNGKIKILSDEYSQFNNWNYKTEFLKQIEITKSEIDTNNFLEGWKLIIIQPS